MRRISGYRQFKNNMQFSFIRRELIAIYIRVT